MAAYSTAAAEGHSVENNGKLILHVKNQSEIDIDVTIRSGYTVNGLKLSDREINVPAGQGVFIGPLEPTIYNQGQQVSIDYSSVEGVYIAALLIP
jgi:hypothetical protein